jgi:hypothetical protein
MAQAIRKSDEDDSKKKKVEVYNFDQLRKRYEDKTQLAIVSCVLSSELVGGMSATRAGVEVFVKHHMKLEGEAAEKEVSRIMSEEIGERDVAPEEGELREKRLYGINVLRRSEHGPWLKDHMFKAALKAAASRIGIFEKKKGSKGDVAELGEVKAWGVSLVEADHPERVYLRTKDGKKPAPTYFDEKKGRVTSPQGSKSIVTQSECVAPGAVFEFAVRFGDKKLSKPDVLDMFAMAMTIGLGSAKAFECGKFRITNLEYQDVEKEAKA